MLRRVTETQTLRAHRLRLRFEDGVVGIVDLGGNIARGGVFASLQDAAVFRQASIAGGGRWLEWPGEIDLCADALWQEIASTQPSGTQSALPPHLKD